MKLLTLLHQAVLFLHLIAFALTVSMVLRADWHLLRQRRVDPARMARNARAAMLGLSVLWSTGIALLLLGAAASTGPWVPGAGLLAKLIVVSVLTINGLALHLWVFARWSRVQGIASLARWWLATALAAVSAASWICASFIGVARQLSPRMALEDFMVLYGAAIGIGLAFGLATLWTGSAAAEGPAVQKIEA